jgi:restriction system protein
MKGTRRENKIIKFIRITLIIVLFPFVMLFLVKSYLKYKKSQKENSEKIKIYDISQINSLSGTEFESYLKLLFEKMGYRVSLTKKSKDFGVDLILEKNGRKTIMQAKCYSKTVGVSAVQEIISARNHYKIFDAIVIANQTFSKEARILAEESKVMLAGREELEGLVKKYPVYFERENQKYVATKFEAIKEIEDKYPYWI